MVVECYHVAYMCGDNENTKKKIFFFKIGMFFNWGKIHLNIPLGRD